jgi:hypothetical protein
LGNGCRKKMMKGALWSQCLHPSISNVLRCLKMS